MAIPKSTVPTVVNLIPVEQRNEETLINMYSERIGDVNEHIKQRLLEYFGYIRNARKEDNDWFSWCHRAIMQVATKTTVDQRTIGYLIGVFKSWLTNGFGTYLNAEVYKIRELFEAQFGMPASTACMDKISHMVQEYGITYTVSSILGTQMKDADMSLLIAQACERNAQSKYSKIGAQA